MILDREYHCFHVLKVHKVTLALHFGLDKVPVHAKNVLVCLVLDPSEAHSHKYFIR